ncbi:HipA N-terminal domain-containing protein [Flavitalea sp.]|nr:HipA N-terminal domain-containing protein [Flavitalea sp.]
MRQAIVKYKDIKAGMLQETDDGEYTFSYSDDYIKNFPQQFVSFQLPVNNQLYRSKRLFPFFDGLIPEGWLLNITIESWRINRNDRMGLLLAVGKSCIGAVSIHQIKNEDAG